jgi:glutathione S-transferase
MLIVHHLGISQSDRVLWLCEELGLPYEMRKYDRDPVTRLAPDAYKALHPAGTAPVIQDGELVLAESGAIVEYLLGRYGNVRLTVAPDHADYGNYLFWLHYAGATLSTTAMMRMMLEGAGAPADHPMRGFVAARTDAAYGMVERRLGEAPYFAGRELTGADIMMVFPLTTMRLFAPYDLSNSPNTLAYLQRIGARPAFQRAMAKGDPGFEVPLR